MRRARWCGADAFAFGVLDHFGELFDEGLESGELPALLDDHAIQFLVLLLQVREVNLQAMQAFVIGGTHGQPSPWHRSGTTPKPAP